MTRNELLKKWCAAEGGKVSALNAPQSREAYAKLRRIIGEECGVDLDDIIREKGVGVLYGNDGNAAILYCYLPLTPDGRHMMPKRKRVKKTVKK